MTRSADTRRWPTRNRSPSSVTACSCTIWTDCAHEYAKPKDHLEQESKTFLRVDILRRARVGMTRSEPPLSDREGFVRIDRPALDRWFWLAVLLTAALVIPRSVSIARAHSESYDDPFYLVGGLALLTREPMERVYNDPPLGQVIEAVPLWLTGSTLGAAARHARIDWISAFGLPILYGQPVSHDTL